MLYGAIRIALCLAALILFLVWHKKRGKPWTKRKMLAWIAVFLLTVTVSGYVPAENLFLSFSTPEDSFAYTNVEAILGIAEGRGSCLICYKTDSDSYARCVIPKAENRYKVSTPLTFETVYSEMYLGEDTLDNAHLSVTRAKNTEDYYVTVQALIFGDTEFSVQDSSGTVFQQETLSANAEYGCRTILVYAFVGAIREGYYVQIQDEKFPIPL